MKKAILVALCAVVLICSLSISSCLYVENDKIPDVDPKWSDDFDLLGKVLTYVKANYIGDVDLDKLDYITAYSLISALDDFSYMTDEAISLSSNASLGVSITKTKYNEYIVNHVFEGFPMGEVKDDGFVVQRGDHIYAVNGERVEGAPNSYFSELVQGGTDKEFVFTITRGGKVMGDYSYTKIEKHVPAAYYISDLDKNNPNIGYIKLTGFSESKLSTGEVVSASTEFDNCVADMLEDKKTSLILDLRGNPGGSASILAHIASYFVPLNGKETVDILSLTYEKKQQEYMVTVSENNYLDMPVVVLVDENTASAAEALTGACRAYNPKATIIGTKTFGKGVFQSRSPQIKDTTSTSYVFDDYYYIMLVSGYYYIIDPNVEGGRYCIHENGIVPDVEVKGTTEGALENDLEVVEAIKQLT